MTECEKLIEELKNYFPKLSELSIGHIHGIADFIIEDRRRIVKPLIKMKNKCPKENWLDSPLDYAVDQTLKLAGIE